MVLVCKDLSPGVQVHQLLCGRDIAKNEEPIHIMAAQMANFVYIIADVSTRKACIVDPAWDTDGCFHVAKELGFSLDHALFTHRHFDHTGGNIPRSVTGVAICERLPGLADFYNRGVTCHVGARDIEAVAKQTGVPKNHMNSVSEGDIIVISPSITIEIIETPGHTPGSVCFKLADFLFTGDTLFIGSCGRVDLPESNVSEMLASLARLGKLNEGIMVFPGHNYAPETYSSIGKESMTNGMMMQALIRQQKATSGTSGILTEPVAAMIPLPDYLGISRYVLNRFNYKNGSLPKSNIGGTENESCNDSESRRQVRAAQLESHF